jgi:putative flippase GtrA
MTALAFDRPAPVRAARLRLLPTLVLFAKNSAAGAVAFALDLALLWLLVERGGWAAMPAAAIAFIVAASLHYALARRFVFAGSTRGVASGYLFFLVNAGIGLVVTLGLFAMLIEWAGLPWMLARLLSSLKAGILGFTLNAVFNFRVL